MKKRLFPLLLLVAICLTAIASASDIVPYWNNIHRITPILSISNNTASCNVSIVANSDTSRIDADIVLQEQNSRGNYVNKHSWNTKTVYNTPNLNFYDTVSNLTAGDTYRLKVTVTVYNSSGVSETATVYSSTQTNN